MIFPFLRRNIIEPLYSVYNKSPRQNYWHTLEKTQFQSEANLKQVQKKRLTELLQFADRNNAFYKERFKAAGFAPLTMKEPDEIKKIPLLTKEDVAANTDHLISSGFIKKDLHCFKTGGSTGKSLKLFITEECSELRNACARRHDRWTGWEVGEPIGACWGNPEYPTSLKGRLRNWLLTPLIYLDTMAVTDDAVREFSRQWQRNSPTLLYGHAHSIYILAQYVEKLSISSITPKGILSTSMMLLPHERYTIERVFKVKVTDRYGCEEVSLIASECEKHEGLHLNIEHLYIEFITDNGTDALPGEPGKIVITDLMNYAMPFIRYSVEDVGVPTTRTCSCGRGLPLMESVTGRVADFLVKQDGTKVAGISLIENTLTKIPGITQMQIIQTSLNDIRLNLVPGEQFSEQTANELSSYFQNLFGNHTKITINQVSEIQPEANGKYRFSICEM